jgi:prophage regulatory protein
MQADTFQLIRRARVEDQTGLSKSELYRLIAAGKFPAPLPKEQGERASLWVASEVSAWVKARIARRESQREQSQQQRAQSGRFAAMGAE